MSSVAARKGVLSRSEKRQINNHDYLQRLLPGNAASVADSNRVAALADLLRERRTDHRRRESRDAAQRGRCLDALGTPVLWIEPPRGGPAHDRRCLRGL